MSDLSEVPKPPIETDAAMYSGYDGANPSPLRSQVFWNTLETREELDSFSREELMRRIRFG